jgi:hypothetical protein
MRELLPVGMEGLQRVTKVLLLSRGRMVWCDGEDRLYPLGCAGETSSEGYTSDSVWDLAVSVLSVVTGHGFVSVKPQQGHIRLELRRSDTVTDEELAAEGGRK